MKFKKTIPAVAAALVAVAALQTAVHAHYVWATVEKGQARFALLDNLAEKPNPLFAKYVADISPRFNGKPVPAGDANNGARYAALPAGQGVVEAESVVGVRDRDGETYLLTYNAKGAVSLAAAGQSAKGPADLSARRDGDDLAVSVRQNGAPVPAKTEVWVQWPGDETPSSALTNDKGEARAKWPVAAKLKSGFVGVRALVVEAKAGEQDGKKYPSIHRWATLTFPVAAPKPVVAVQK